MTPTTTPWRNHNRPVQDRANPRRRTGRDISHVEAVTLEWVHWYNTERTHQAIDDLSPEAAEQLHYRFKATLEQAG